MKILDLNIKVKIDSPDILNGFLALADEISKFGVAPKEVDKARNIAPKEIVEQAVPETEKEVEKLRVITLEEIRTKLTSLSQSGKQAEVKALIKGFGVSKLTDIPKEKYPELLKAAEAI